MDFIRIGDKIISKEKIMTKIEKVFDLRVKGLSQQEVAKRLSLDRALVSRLETLGEIRKGSRIAVLGFPVKNKDELLTALKQEGVEYSLILTEKERWAFVDESTGLELFNKVTNIMAALKGYDYIVMLGSNKRIKLFQGIFDCEVVGMEIGQSPIEEDKLIDVNQVKTMIQWLKGIKHEEERK